MQVLNNDLYHLINSFNAEINPELAFPVDMILEIAENTLSIGG